MRRPPEPATVGSSPTGPASLVIVAAYSGFSGVAIRWWLGIRVFGGGLLWRLCLFFASVAYHKGFRFFIVPCEGDSSGALGFIDLCLV
jgi:hypothetical protein